MKLVIPWRSYKRKGHSGSQSLTLPLTDGKTKTQREGLAQTYTMSGFLAEPDCTSSSCDPLQCFINAKKVGCLPPPHSTPKAAEREFLKAVERHTKTHMATLSEACACTHTHTHNLNVFQARICEGNYGTFIKWMFLLLLLIINIRFVGLVWRMAWYFMNHEESWRVINIT